MTRRDHLCLLALANLAKVCCLEPGHERTISDTKGKHTTNEWKLSGRGRSGPSKDDHRISGASGGVVDDPKGDAVYGLVNPMGVFAVVGAVVVMVQEPHPVFRNLNALLKASITEFGGERACSGSEAVFLFLVAHELAAPACRKRRRHAGGRQKGFGDGRGQSLRNAASLRAGRPGTTPCRTKSRVDRDSLVVSCGACPAFSLPCVLLAAPWPATPCSGGIPSSKNGVIVA